MQVVNNNIIKYLVLAFTILSCQILVSCDDSNKTTNVAESQSTGKSPHTKISKKSTHIVSVDSVWSNMSHKFELDHKVQYARVRSEIHRIQSNRDDFYHSLESALPYIYYIYKQTELRGLPAELALIPIIESDFDPNNRTGNALGLWQLMPQTASELGVKMYSGYDGRRDVVASTKAALSYFNDLNKFFHGNWYLAIAAYNCGQYRVKSAQRNSGNTSFWELPLPRETKVYVPRLLAIAEVIKHPKKYGVQLPPISNKPYFTEIKLKKTASLSKVSKTAGISMKTLHKLNPDYRANEVVHKKGSYPILVPVEKAPIVKSEFSHSA